MSIFPAKKGITPDTILQRKPDLLFNEIDGEVVMLNIENSEYYGLDKVGSRIWNLIEHPLSLKDLIFKLMNEFDISEQQCINDTLAFLTILTDKKLIITQ